MSLASWFARASVSDAEVRAEIWRLGARHHGEPLEGALAELKAGGLSDSTTALLRACVHQLRRR